MLHGVKPILSCLLLSPSNASVSLSSGRCYSRVYPSKQNCNSWKGKGCTHFKLTKKNKERRQQL